MRILAAMYLGYSVITDLLIWGTAIFYFIQQFI